MRAKFFSSGAENSGIEKRADTLGLRATRDAGGVGLRVTRDDGGVGLRVTRSHHVNMDGFKRAENLEGKYLRGIVDHFGRV